MEGAGVCAEGERGKEWGVVQCSMQKRKIRWKKREKKS